MRGTVLRTRGGYVDRSSRMRRPLSGEGLMSTGFGDLKVFSGSAHPQLTREIIVKHARVAAAAWRIFRIYRRVAAGAHILYTDQAMTPVTEDETQMLELFTHNKSAREAVDHARKIKILTALGSAAAQSTV